MADTASAESYRSRYGIEKLQDHNYHTWSFQCQMLLAEKAIEKTVSEWEERNAEALRIISFTVIDRLQGPILYGKNAKGAWEELQKVHAPRDRQRKYSLLRRLYRLDMQTGTPLRDHE